MSLTEQIKTYALDIGYHAVGITTADPFDDHVAEVTSRSTMYDFYSLDPRKFMEGALVKKMMPQACSIICMVLDYARTDFPVELVGKIGRIYQARCYGPAPDRINGARYGLMVKFLEKLGAKIGKGFIIPERRAAARAGVITFGKNNFAYAKGCGSFIVLHSIVVDLALEYDTPTLRVECPENCTECLNACPTKAIYEPLKLNPRRCISFNNWWTQEGRPPGITGFIPFDIRERMGTKIHGCDVCQEVCPRNQVRLRTKLPKDPFLEKIARQFSLSKMLLMHDGFYQKTIRPIMYNYIQEKKYFQRNAAIALGNLKDHRFIPDLAKAMTDPESMVRGASAWALGRIGGEKAKRILNSSLSRENDGEVRKEISTALKN